MHANNARFLASLTNHTWARDEFGRIDLGAGGYCWERAEPLALCVKCGYTFGVWSHRACYSCPAGCKDA
jgi:hypothetical protein